MSHSKVCKHCGIEKDLSLFHYKPKAERYESTCKVCANERSRRYRKANKNTISRQRKQYRADNKEHILAQKRRSDLKRNYGITESEYGDILKSQNGCCAICGTSKSESDKRFAVDHNHKTGDVRGVLCSSCNLGLGNLGDDPEILIKAALYLMERGYYGSSET